MGIDVTDLMKGATLEKEMADDLAETLEDIVVRIEPVIEQEQGVTPSGGMKSDAISDLLQKLGAEDGDSTGSGRVNFERSVFGDGSGQCIEVTYTIGTIWISPSGRVARFEV